MWRVQVSAPTGRRSKVVRGTKREALDALAELSDARTSARRARSHHGRPARRVAEGGRVPRGRHDPQAIPPRRRERRQARPGPNQARSARRPGARPDGRERWAGAWAEGSQERLRHRGDRTTPRSPLGWLSADLLERRTAPMSVRHEIEPPPPNVVDLLLGAAGDPDFELRPGLAAVSGARRGELCGLRFSDIDFDSRSPDRLRSSTVGDSWPRARRTATDAPSHSMTHGLTLSPDNVPGSSSAATRPVSRPTG